jgi:dihydroorotase
MHTILIKNGRLIDPINKIDEITDVFVQNGRVEKIGKEISTSAEKTIDASGKIVCPGLIDLQVHFREPGREDRETIETGLRAAIKGGITSVVTMPNLNPVADNQAVIGFQIKRAKEVGLGNIFPSGAITRGQEGKRISEMREMKLAGAVAVTDDGVDVQSAGLLEKAMEWAKTFDLLLMSHCEEESLREEGVLHEGEWSTRLGLPGISEEVEDYGVFRNILLAQKTGVRFHALHCSSKRGLDIIAQAKKEGFFNISCETCPQYFALTDEVCNHYNTFAKMYPPIRSEDHRQAVIRRLQDGTIDVISTDHAPHLMCDKFLPFLEAPPGSVGVETSLAVGITHLVKPKHLSYSQLIEKMSVNPSRIIGIDRGNLSLGAIADITIFDPEKEWMVDPEQFESKGKNSIFAGMKLKGKTTDVIVDGKVKMENELILVEL